MTQWIMLAMFAGERFPPEKEIVLDEPDNPSIGWVLNLGDGIPAVYGPYDDADVAQGEADEYMLRMSEMTDGYTRQAVAYVLEIDCPTVADGFKPPPPPELEP